MLGAPYDTKDQNGYTPLHLACNQNDFESVMVLINFGADINAETVNGVTPLYMGEFTSTLHPIIVYISNSFLCTLLLICLSVCFLLSSGCC